MSFCVYVMLSVNDQNKTIVSNRAPWENYKYDDVMKIGVQLLLIFESWKMGGGTLKVQLSIAFGK